ncbi:MAG TPA: PQQ-dependent sugar dehydrogenase [Dehalococcoidia bacterium]|nr:PQQ-dependent sugar dehydrogenase [Dehalococcoidia bacterium]
MRRIQTGPVLAAAAGAAVLMALAVALIGGAVTPWGGGSEAEASGTSIQLVEHWNLVAASRGGTPQQVVGVIARVESIHRWNGRAFESWRRTAPDFANTLTFITVGEGLWVEVSGPVTWNLPPQGDTFRPLNASGFQLIGWTDPDASAADALVQLRAEKLIGWDENAQGFNNFDPTLPGPLNSLAQVQRGRAYWALFDLNTLPPIGLDLVFDADAPVDVIPFDADEVLIVEQEGLLRRFNMNTGMPTTTLIDIRNDTEFRGENGLLSAALDPAYGQNGLVYLYFSVAGQNRTRLLRITTIGETQVPGSEVTILQIPQPFANHNGGRLVFGPDGFLYLGIGDGGSDEDSDGHGQNRDTLLGSIIRIDVDRASTQTPYVVPDDNPFVGVPGAAPEVFAYGFRNPWRMAFDEDTGQLWVGDVGEAAVEEIDVVVPGGQLRMEYPGGR